MDKIFKYSVGEMLLRLRYLEPEMREAMYNDNNEEYLDNIARYIYDYLEEIFTYMKKNYKEHNLTITTALRELYTICITGEVSKFQDIEDIKYINNTFKHLSTFNGVAQAQYLVNLLKYYYLVYEDNEPIKLEKLECEANRFCYLSRINMYKRKVPKNTVAEMCSSEEFITSLKNHLDTFVIGQDTIKKQLITILYQWLFFDIRTTFLMIGPSGCGKNHIIETIKTFKGLNHRVLMSYDCSSLSPSGFEGSSINDIFKKLNMVCSRAGMSADGSIIYLDEIDKIINFCHDSHNESINAMVQQQLLSSLAGTETIQGVDTSRILFILGGAFPLIDSLKKERAKHTMGFRPLEKSVLCENTSTIREQLRAIGGEGEFIGRIEHISHFSKLTREELKVLLLDKNIGEFTKKKQLFHRSGLDLEMEEDVVESILDLIQNDDSGARSVKYIMNEFANSQYFYDMMTGGYNKMIIHKGMLYGEAPIFINDKGRKI